MVTVSETDFAHQQIFSADDIQSIKGYCVGDGDAVSFGASVVYISCYKKKDATIVHAILDCVVICLGHSPAGLSLQLAAPLGDGNYIRMATGDVVSLVVTAPIFGGSVLAVADHRHIDAIANFFASAGVDAGPVRPSLRLVKS
ncbi:hypothetical protein [Azospirillum sp. B4]|uniref:hypothetical protein n=1 Tax=Azospirillum sp. B4 TaxID=95605 RepID=UPI0003495334|nr:hypothetical protein [Azospirillum sp. B4]